MSSQEMTATEKVIRTLKQQINPDTGEGYEYAEIGAMLGISKQAAAQHIHHKQGCCPKCLRRLKPARKTFPLTTTTTPEASGACFAETAIQDLDTSGITQNC